MRLRLIRLATPGRSSSWPAPLSLATMGELEIPVLDLGPLLIGGSTEAEAERLLDGLAAQLASACGRVGFLKLTGCDAVVPPALVDEVFAVTERFHDLDLEAKLALGLDAPTMRGAWIRLSTHIFSRCCYMYPPLSALSLGLTLMTIINSVFIYHTTSHPCLPGD